MTDDSVPAADDRRGTLGVDPGGEWQVRFERRIRHAPDRVWASLVDVEQQAVWVPGVQIHARVGGPVVFDFGPEGRAEGKVLVVEPPRVLEHTWIWPGEPSSTVRWEIAPDGTGSIVVLWHRPVRPGPAVDYATGWHVMLDALELHLDGGDPAAVEPDFAGLHELYSR